jgi:phosphoribosylamine--glycine ligase
MPPVNVLIIGSGGREHALAWKLAQSPRVGCIWVAPGNGGTEAPSGGLGAPIANVALDETDFAGLIDFSRQEGIGLTVVGPEAPLAAGLADAFHEAGLSCFGPSRRAARLESSKAYAKAFMERHGIPTGRYARFSDFGAALAHLSSVPYPVVIKASGLAAGKGVIVPETVKEAEAALQEIMIRRSFGAAGDEVLIEERLSGPEVSLLAFSDGVTVVPMPTAQDHKRAYDGDRGPNTGGMGAYAPAPWVGARDIEEWTRAILQPAVDGMRAEGSPYVGVLYAGLMLTGDGPKVLEFNCRFGDPETQVILPLLDIDLFEILQACTEERLSDIRIRWREGAATTVVVAAGGYPGSYRKELPIAGIEDAEAVPGVVVFHAGTRRTEKGALVTNGGRVLAVTGAGPSLEEALATAYRGVQAIRFEGMHYRRDIAAGAHRRDAEHAEN